MDPSLYYDDIDPRRNPALTRNLMASISGVDPETMRLIIQTQLEDLQEMARANAPKGKGRPGERDSRADFMAAIEAYRADLTATAQSLADEAMCKSIANAVDADADLIGAALSQEDQTTRDRELAFELSGRRRSAAARRQNVSETPFMSTTTDEDALERLRELNVSSASPITHFPGLYYTQQTATATGQAESSAWAQSRRHGQNPRPPNTHEARPCVACTEFTPTFNLSKWAPCGHEYCRDCLSSLFNSSLTDETLFPPKCCGQEIPVYESRRFLTRAVIAAFYAKKVEFDTPNRTYCCRQACSTFVPPQFIQGEVAHCPRPQCGARTCTVCKGATHVGNDCPADPATQDVLRLAAAEGWRRCYACARFVELDNGCNHITCRCGAQFCYVCGEPWKTCGCVQWDERNLLDRANAIVDRDAGAHPMAHRQRANLVEQERVNLMDNHECDHASWRSRGGRHRCEECSDVLNTFIYECRQCHIMACRRCRYNRL